MPAPVDPPDAPERTADLLVEDREPEVPDVDVVHHLDDELDEDLDDDAAGPPPAPAPPPPLDPNLPPFRRWWEGLLARSGMEQLGVAVDVVAVASVVVFVVVSLHPNLLVMNTTPAGGDMGAHVWGPAYLRDNLLPSFRLSGWSPDWYAGFPAYVFYMVVPALAIVALDAGFSGWAALVPLAGALALLAVSGTHRDRRVRRLAFVAAVVGGVLLVGLPYGVAFKFVAVSGLVALPVAAYVFGRLADLPFPTPALLSVGSIVFLYNIEPDTNGTGNIIGGNMASTLAGEFSFSISLALLVLYLGLLLRGLRTGRHQASAAVVLALTSLCHIIPAIYAVIATVVAVLVSLPLDRARLRWFLPVGPVALAVSAFWTVPFVLNRAYLNDMGWEKLPPPCSAGATDCITFMDYLAPNQLVWVLVMAGAGAVISLVLKIRAGVLLAACAGITAVLFVVIPPTRLWNARLLPFLYLCVVLLAAIAVAEVFRAIGALTASGPERPANPFTLGIPIVVGILVLGWTGLRLGMLPGIDRDNDGNHLGPFSISEDSRTVVRSWAAWNFSGYEEKPAYPEYHAMLEMAQGVAADPELGCGRVMWEYESDRLDRYGTPMAPMLLPFWTDGCMGSMEGLFFEASATTPYHFLVQRSLSANCSCAQRDMPYGTFDIDVGVEQLQTMGVRYYFAFSEQAVAAAQGHPELREVGSTDVWHAFLVLDSALVEPLEFEPAVLTGINPGMDWVGPASKWFRDPAVSPVFYAEDGPSSWQRAAVCDEDAEAKPNDAAPAAYEPRFVGLDVCEAPVQIPLADNTVSAVTATTDSISFDVSTPGQPVLVRASYFPNWQASGAEGPYRVTPNLMVVIPTDTHVELSYGWRLLDIVAYSLSVLGIVAAVVLGRRRVVEPKPLWLDGPDTFGRPEPVPWQEGDPLGPMLPPPPIEGDWRPKIDDDDPGDG